MFGCRERRRFSEWSPIARRNLVTAATRKPLFVPSASCLPYAWAGALGRRVTTPRGLLLELSTGQPVTIDRFAVDVGFILTETILYSSFNKVVRIYSLKAALGQLRFYGIKVLDLLT
jgi:hypothetical protein